MTRSHAAEPTLGQIERERDTDLSTKATVSRDLASASSDLSQTIEPPQVSPDAEALARHIEKALATAPQITDEQRALLARLVTPRRAAA